MNTFLAHLQDEEGVEKHLILYPGITHQEVKDLITSSFGSSEEVVGLYDTEQDVIYPISILSKVPSFFSSSPAYTLLKDTSISLLRSGSSMDIDTLSSATGLSGNTFEQTFHIFRSFANHDNALSKEDFFLAFQAISSNGGSGGSDGIDVDTVNHLFEVFDADGNGVVDLQELSSGLSILCGAELEDENKILTAFRLQDLDGNGFIDPEEMCTYLTSMFKILAATHSSPYLSLKPEEGKVTPEEFAEITTKFCFQEADLDGDGQLSFEEFHDWINSSSTHSHHNPDSHSLVEIAEQAFDIEEARRITGLGSHNISWVLHELVRAVDTEDGLSRDAFMGAFARILESGAPHGDLKHILNSLFEFFDLDGNGTVDVNEIMVGLSIICGGSLDDKMRVAFDLIDEDDDGEITWEEMNKYLGNLFRVLYENNPELFAITGIPFDHLAACTANLCFSEADINNDGTLTFSEFAKWFCSDQSSDFRDIFNQDQEIRQISSSTTKTSSFTPSLIKLENQNFGDIYKLIKSASDQEGYVSLTNFRRIFSLIVNHPSSGRRSSTDLSQNELVFFDTLFEVIKEVEDLDFGNQEEKVEVLNLSIAFFMLLANKSDLDCLLLYHLLDHPAKKGSIHDDDGISFDIFHHFLYLIFYVHVSFNGDNIGDRRSRAYSLSSQTIYQIFADKGDVTDLAYEEFSNWIHTTQAGLLTFKNSLWLDIFDVSHLSSHEIFSHLSQFANDRRCLNFDDFKRAIHHLLKITHFNQQEEKNGGVTSPMPHVTDATLNELFKKWDLDGNGELDFTEIATALTILTGDSEDEKLRMAFQCYDSDGDGFIDKSEMEQFLTTVYHLMRDMDQVNYDETQLSPIQRARETTELAFIEADVNNDGKISLEEFMNWAKKDTQTHNTPPPSYYSPHPSSSQNQQQQNQRSGSFNSTPQQFITEDAIQMSFLMKGKELLAKTDPAHISYLANLISARDVNEGQFVDIFCTLIGGQYREVDRRIAQEIFRVIDVDGNGILDKGELGAMLTVLCGNEEGSGGEDDNYEKLMIAFELLDNEGNGLITQEQLELYMVTVYTIYFQLYPNVKKNLSTSIGANEVSLAKITSKQTFQLLKSEFMTFEEFYDYFGKGGTGGQTSSDQQPPPQQQQQQQQTASEGFGRPLSRVSVRPWRENLLPQSSHPVYMEESEESEEDDEEEEESSGGDFFSMGSQSSTSTSSNPFSTDHHITALRRLRSQLDMNSRKVDWLIRVFGKSGVIEKDEFLRRFKNEIVGKAHFSIVDSFADVLYETLQLQNGNIEVVDALWGVSVLCGGENEEKISKVMSVCHPFGLTFEEFSYYLTIIFKVMALTMEDVRFSHPHIIQNMAYALATTLFEQSDLDIDRGQIITSQIILRSME